MRKLTLSVGKARVPCGPLLCSARSRCQSLRRQRRADNVDILPPGHVYFMHNRLHRLRRPDDFVMVCLDFIFDNHQVQLGV